MNQPHLDLHKKINHIGLFEGIGGFSLAAKWMGWKTIAWCEINPFGQQVLKHYYPEAKGHGDIKTTDFTIYRGQCDILTGGFPCQPFSTAGKRKGTKDDRHLWPEMLRAIREIQPRWIVGENVGGFVNWSGGLVFEQVQADLEAEGYEVQPFILPAAGVNAPHRRDRVWFVANASSTGGFQYRNSGSNIDRDYKGSECGRDNEQNGASRCTSKPKNATNPCCNGRKRAGEIKSNNNQGIREGVVEGYEFDTLRCDGSTADASNSELQGGLHEYGRLKAERFVSTRDSRDNASKAWDNFPSQPPVRVRNDGVPAGLSGITVSSRSGRRTLSEKQAIGRHRNESLKAYGNAIVPQVALEIFRAIEKIEEA